MKERGWKAPKKKVAKKKAAKKKAKKKAKRRTPRRSARKNPSSKFQLSLQGEGVQELKDALAGGVKNFSFAHFDGKDLSGMDLSGTEFRFSQFSLASLKGTSLRDADMDEQVFIQADLSNADLYRGLFRKANLTHAKLRNVHAQEAVFDRANLLSADLSGADLAKASLKLAVLRAIDGSGADFSITDLSGAQMDGALLTWADFTGSVFDNTWLQNATLMGANFKGVTFKNMRWHDVDLRGVLNVPPSMLNEWSQATGLALAQTSKIMGQLGISESLKSPLDEVDFGDALPSSDDLVRRREDENLRWSMAHEVPGVEDEGRAARWRDEAVEEDSMPWEKEGSSFADWMTRSNPGDRWKKIPDEDFPKWIWSPGQRVLYTVKRMYGSMFADRHKYVYSVTRNGPRSESRIHDPGVDSKHINTLKEAKKFAEDDAKKRKAPKKKATKRKRKG
jgi:uncharacterized protein YjbI with pentapeptide repeats